AFNSLLFFRLACTSACFLGFWGASVRIHSAQVTMLRLVLGLACCLLPLSAAAQFTDNFSDGDFTADPAWTGTTDRWTVGDLDGDLALQTNGEAASDTLFLAT